MPEILECITPKVHPWKRIQGRYPHAKNKVGSLLNIMQKINSKWIKSLNERAKTLRRKMGINLNDLGLGDGFLDMTQNA